MQINGFQAVATAGRAGEARAKGDLAARRDQLVDALRSTTDDKALAKARLERARQFLDMLKRWGFPPDVIAQQAAKLGVETRAALQQYVSAAGNAEAGDADADSAAKAGAKPRAEVEESPDETSPSRSFVEKAYLEAMDGSGAAGGLSAEDRRTIAEFKALLREVRALQEKAEREAGRTDDPPDAGGTDVAPVSPGRRGPGAG